MAEDPSLGVIAQQHFSVYDALFRELNPVNAPSVPAAEAANFLKRSGLPIPALGMIWELADYQKQGSLDKKGAFIAFKLVAAAQQGQPIAAQSVYLDGLNAPAMGSGTTTPALSQGYGSMHASPNRVQDNQSPVTPGNYAIQPADQVKYDSIFDSLGPENGKIPGAKVRPVLLNSGLGGPVLAKIWELSDQDKDGQLDRIEMSVALHLVYRALQNEPVPSVLPPSLIHPSKAALSRRTSVASQQASEYSLAARNRTASVASLEGASLRGVPPMSYGVDPQRSISVQPTAFARGSISGTPVRNMSVTSLEWPVDRSETAAIFAQCDTDRDGLVSGADVKDEFIKTGLPNTILAQIWGLADVHQTGTLNQEQFALAMHLVTMSRSGEPLPQTLPPQLVPPTMRHLQLQENGRESVDISAPVPPVPGNLAADAQSENPEVRQLAEEMERLVVERREAEENIAQLEADMTVKNSEIRNLQIELTTLENTVKALERQKAEAGKRLADMDTQIAHLEEQCSSQKEKVSEAEERLNNLKEETEQGAARSEESAKKLAESREALASLESEGRALSAELLQEQRSMELTVEQLTRLERGAEVRDKEADAIQAETKKVLAVTEKLQQILNKEDPFEDLASQPDVFQQFKSIQMLGQAPFSVQSTSNNAPTSNGFAQDPFAPQRPAFSQQPQQQRSHTAPLTRPIQSSSGVSDPFASSTVDPFASSSSATASPFGFSAMPPSSAFDGPIAADPFAGQDPFAATPAGAAGKFTAAFPTEDPFGGAGADPFSSASSVPQQATATVVPPRPMPPRPAPPAASRVTPQPQPAQPINAADPFGNSDPFGAPPPATSSAGFADFAKFGAFS